MENIVATFFDRTYEASINDKMLYYDYIFPKEEMEDYILSIIATSYGSFIDYIHEHICPIRFDSSAQVPQISSYDLCTYGVCKVLNAINDPGVSYLDFGRFLYPTSKRRTKFSDIDNLSESAINNFADINGTQIKPVSESYVCLDGKIRKKGAIIKMAENQLKGASFHGLVYELGDKWFLTCLGKVYSTLDEEFQHYLSARTLLRAPFFRKVISEAVDHDVDILPYIRSVCNNSTTERRSSSCMRFIDICINQAKIESYTLHSIFGVRKSKSIEQ